MASKTEYFMYFQFQRSNLPSVKPVETHHTSAYFLRISVFRALPCSLPSIHPPEQSQRRGNADQSPCHSLRLHKSLIREDVRQEGSTFPCGLPTSLVLCCVPPRCRSSWISRETTETLGSVSIPPILDAVSGRRFSSDDR